jgi:hypothetical protein
MENETVNQEQATKTFTQSELDAIISDRLKRERDKYADYETLKEKATRFDEIEEESKTELQKAHEKAEKLESELTQLRKAEEIRTIREKVATEHGIPTNLLTGETEETCIEQAKALIEFKGQATYPTVKDGGEVQNTIKGTTRQQFADWANAALN